MAAFGGLIITNRGRALQAKAQIGTQLVFTRIAVGDGDLGGSSILDLTALKHEVKSLPITKIKTLSGGKAVLGAILSNQDITQGFYLREIGVFAQDPDLGEILYCYGNAGALAEYIPAGGGPDIIEKNIDIITIVGNASSASAVIDESLIFETPTGAQEKADIAENNAKAYADQQVATRVLNAGSTPSIQAGPDASKPAPGTAGRLYVATDTQIIYRDTGTAWQKVGVVKWGDIEGKPSSFPPSAHTHAGSDITSKVASASAADTVPWSGVSGKPTSFPPSAHKDTHKTGGTDALTPGDIGAAAASDLTAHLAETVITANKTINVPGDFATIQGALDSLKKAWIPRDVTVTIQVAAGIYNHTSPIIIDHPQGSRIKIIGATPVTTTITGVGTITGAAGNWSVPILVQSTSGIAAGDYVIIKDTTGTGNHYAFSGIWKVISVDSATQITVQNTHRASTFPTATLSGGTVVVLKTILKFNGCHGVLVSRGRALGLIDNIALVGDGQASWNGLFAGIGAENDAGAGASAVCGSNFGVSNFGGNGFAATRGSSIVASSTASCSNLNGYLAYAGGIISCTSSIANGNGSFGFAALMNGFVSSEGCVANGNGFGFNAENAGMVLAQNTIASNNLQFDYRAIVAGVINVYGYQGSPTFSPALNTVGNSNSIISTG